MSETLKTPEVCRECGGPVRRHPADAFIVLHDNATGWYAGRQMDHDAEVAMNRYRVLYQVTQASRLGTAFVMEAEDSLDVWKAWGHWNKLNIGGDYYAAHVINEGPT